MSEKLVRDRIPELLARLGINRRFRTVLDRERLPWLLAKCAEECGEVIADPSAEEIADLLEVLQALASQCGLDWASVEKVQHDKRRERGGFDEGFVMEVVD